MDIISNIILISSLVQFGEDSLNCATKRNRKMFSQKEYEYLKEVGKGIAKWRGWVGRRSSVVGPASFVVCGGSWLITSTDTACWWSWTKKLKIFKSEVVTFFLSF